MSNLHEECGVFGIFSTETQDVASTTYYGLFALQHRGQESCGIVVNDRGLFNYQKDVGLLNDVFNQLNLKSLGTGQIAVGHCRYGTTGKTDRVNVQPIVVNHFKGRIALAHNGNLVNAFELRRKFESDGHIFHMTIDSEVITHAIIQERLNSDSIEEAVNRTMDYLEGAYSLVIMSPQKLIAVRDPKGFRPLCYGKRDDNTYIVASESCALDAVGAKFIRDVEPGEIIVFSKNGIRSIKDHCHTKKRTACIFEFLYFARPDSVIDGVSVHQARVQAGKILAEAHPVDADIVVGVPDSGLDAALGYSLQSKIPYGMGFIKNKYIGRTFIAPGQKNREDKVRIKLNVIADSIKGKRVVLVDDSIVRGTTITRIVKLLRNAGAKEIHVRSSAPPFTDPCYYGTDVDTKDKLIACQHPIDEIAGVIGADSVGYLPVDELYRIIGTEPRKGYCCSCFTGFYPTRVPTGEKNRFEMKISSTEKDEESEKKDKDSRPYIDYIRD
ncbi:MAG: amidophosphoribosyltransferase [Eubacteriales bacterium]|nr:amidophosphoribosyltransferase [Eubacteriales bacterium]